jgi:VCBS repeat-containing protein
MSNAVAKVSFLQGQAWAKAPDGSLRALAVGSTLNDDEVLVTAQGARVELDVGSNEPLVVNGGSEVGMSRDLVADMATGADEAMLSDTSVQEALTVLNQGGDLLDELEETAAGDTGGGGGEGHGFVQLTRLIETTDGQSFEYSAATAAGSSPFIAEGLGYTNSAPSVKDQTLTSDEDEIVSGQIRAIDLEGDALTFTIATPPANGTLALNPVTGEFVFTPNANYNGVDNFVVTVTDSRGNSSDASFTLNIMPVNDAPTTRDVNLTTDEDTPVNGQVMAEDIDGDTLTYTVSGQPNNGVVSLDPATGAFVYTPNANYNGSDSFVITISDGNGDTIKSTVNIGVTPVNDAPVAVADNITVAEGGTVTVLVGGARSVLANDSDADGDALSALLVSSPTNGTLTLNANGTFSYTHDGSETTSDSFTYKVNDGTVDGNTVTVTIGVTPVNDVPVAVADTISVAEGGTVTVLVSGASSVLANDSDADGDALTAILVSGPTNGTLTLNSNGAFSYTHNGSETTSDSFTYKVNDGTVDGNTVTVTIGVTPLNDAPETNALTVSGNEDTLVTISLAGSDIDGTVAGFVIKSLPANGVLYSDRLLAAPISVGDVVSSPVYFMPNANWNGSTNLTYAAEDNLGLEDATPATVSITIDPVSDPAILGTGAGAVEEDTPGKSTTTGTLTIVDPDAGEQGFQAQTNTLGTYGSFSVDVAGNWDYALDNSKSVVQALKEGETKTDTFTVTSIDGTTTTVVITVIGTNDGPVAVADSANVNQNAVLTLTAAQLLGNDTDIDGDVLSIESVQGGVNGTVSIVDGDVVFTPTAGYHGPASFTYTVNDGHGGTSTATVNVTVIQTNTPPVANDDVAASPGAVNAGLSAEYFSYRENIDGPNLTSVEQIYSFINGRAADAAFVAKTFDYGTSVNFGDNLGTGTNLQGWLGSDVSSLSVDPATSTDAILRMRGFIDLDAGSYNFKVLADDGYQIRIDGVVVAEVNRNQALTTTVHTSFTVATSGLHHVEIIYWDQGANAGLKIELSDDAGASYKSMADFQTYKQATLPALEDTPLSIPVSTLLANDTDADGDTLSIVSVQSATHGSANIVGGNVVFTPTANYSGPASFTYTISDGKGGTATATAYLTVVPVNDAPVAVADSAVTRTNTALTIPISQLLANDTDIDGDILSIISVQGAANGTVSISGSNVIFTPANNFEGIASFTYTARDAFGATSTAGVSVTVGAASTPSIVVAKSLLAIAHGTGGTSAKFPIMASLVDTDGSESLSIKISGVPTGLSFNAGTNLGGGVWAFVESDLPNLMLNLPGSYATIGTNLRVEVISTEMYGGFTSSSVSTVTLKAAYTTVDITTTESGNYTGTAANEYIQGGNGNNVINAGSGNNIVYGGGGSDSIFAGAGADVLFGGSGDDIINSGSGTDRLIGGAGNDTMQGGDVGENFVDVFVWSLGDQGVAGTPAVDTIQNFSTTAAGGSGSGGDVLDLRDLLVGEHVGGSNAINNLADYLHFEVSGSSTIIHVSHTGGFAADSHTVGAGYTSGAETQQIVLSGVNLQSLYSGATTDQQIITQLLNNNKLITD